jgi:hypothetical protein
VAQLHEIEAYEPHFNEGDRDHHDTHESARVGEVEFFEEPK